MDTIFQYILARLAERSTWMGLIGLASAAGVAIAPAEALMIASVGTGLVGAVAVFTKDHNVAEAVEAAVTAIKAPVANAVVEPVANATA
jgi:hypothetical protein